LIIIIIKVLLSICLIWIFLQDLIERTAWNFFLFFIIPSGSFLFYKSTQLEYYLYSVLANSITLVIVGIVIWMIAKIVMRKRVVETIGPGDVLFFIFMAMSFPVIAFIVITVFALAFSLVLHYAFQRLKKEYDKTVPLAGFMSLFILFIYSLHWSGMYPNLYFL
tara:strand:- start:11668 stop:12159 length:492 start_codon:yes stop_codon:yes gene_type:complete